MGLAASLLSGGKLAHGVQTRFILETLARPQTSIVYWGHEVIPALSLSGTVEGYGLRGPSQGSGSQSPGLSSGPLGRIVFILKAGQHGVACVLTAVG